ncbi:MAG: Rrf2 family transcriptional regulator [Candidatus Omnitrophica bacterium]|nr:Rrf2 family transcriptional regulator [Candidatus Omnitrophota bacterium]
MKLLTRYADYGTRALVCISSAPRRTATVQDLSLRLGIPRPILRRIMQTLSKKHLLRSRRGQLGGFSLARSADKINILDVINAFQGDFCLSEHVFKGKRCPLMDTCKLKKTLDVIEGDVVKQLKSITIESLIKG